MQKMYSVTRNALIALLLMFFCTCRKSAPPSIDPNNIIETVAPAPVAVSIQLNEAFRGYYISLPEHYSQTTKKYPLLLFLHGAGQMGNGTTDLHYILKDGIGKLLDRGKFPADFYMGGKHHSFIVVSPQTSRQALTIEVAEFLHYIKTTYRIDEARLYLSGLSLGSRVATLVGARFPSVFAAMVPIAGVSTNAGMVERCDSIAAHNLPVWAFHNLDDPLSDVHSAEQFVNLIKDHSPPVSPRLTIFDVYGHDAWTTALDPSYRENGMNIYEWMLQYSR